MKAELLLENIDLYHFFFLDQLTDDLEYLTLRVDLNEGRFLKIRFGRHDCYRVMDEGDAYRTLHDLYALDVGYSHIYKVTDGDFFNEYHKMTEGIRKDLELNHYIVLLDDHVIDIIGFDDPIVELE